MKKGKIMYIKSDVSKQDRVSFYKSKEWQQIRYMALKKYERRCMCCGASAPSVTIHVDHIKPISTHWKLRNCMNNIQLLCANCNIGKSNIDETNWKNINTVKQVQDELRAENKLKAISSTRKNKRAKKNTVETIVKKPHEPTGAGVIVDSDIVNVHTPWKVLRLLGVSLPPKSGWRSEIIGKEISIQTFHEIQRISKVPAKKNKTKPGREVYKNLIESKSKKEKSLHDHEFFHDKYGINDIKVIVKNKNGDVKKILQGT